MNGVLFQLHLILDWLVYVMMEIVGDYTKPFQGTWRMIFNARLCQVIESDLQEMLEKRKRAELDCKRCVDVINTG
jgi:hypothetical protein